MRRHQLKLQHPRALGLTFSCKLSGTGDKPGAAPNVSLVGLPVAHMRFASGRGSKNWIGNLKDTEETSSARLSEVVKELKSESQRLGLSIIGITSPKPSSRLAKYKDWLLKGYQGALDYMGREDRVARREDPQLILPRAKSVIMVGLFYWPGRSGFPILHDPQLHNGPEPRGSGHPQAQLPAVDAYSRGVLSSYAWGEDYHKILQSRLKMLGKRLNAIAGGVGRFYVDTGAILERDFAERAGLGFVGKNTLVINAQRGSGFFIGELFSTVALPLDSDEDRGTAPRRRGEPGCGKCSKCRVACPTGAIVEDFVVDARRCISYLTIELKGSIPVELRKQMGNRVYGCDICQQVCPWNRIDWTRPDGAAGTVAQGKGGFSPLFGYVDEDVTSPRLEELVQMSEEEFQKRFRGSAVRRIGRDRLARNAAVALGNVGGKAELKVLRQVAGTHKSELVREHAEWGVTRIEKRLATAANQTF